MPDTVRLKAPAKVNLFLEVLGRRKDGYHDLETLFAKVGLCDDVSVRVLKAPGPVRLKLRNLTATPVPDGPENLAVRAAEMFRAEAGLSRGLKIVLVKRIPAGAGLGGGSSDAAAVLNALSRLFPKVPRRRVEALAPRLGADVPVFLRKEGFLVGRGIGDRLKAVAPPRLLAHSPILIVFPGTPVATSAAFAKLASLRRENGLTGRVYLSRLLRVFAAGSPPSLWIKLLFNRLEEAVLPFYPAVAEAKRSLEALGAAPLMSGSGSCVFAVAPGAAAGRRWAARLRRAGWSVWLVGWIR